MSKNGQNHSSKTTTDRQRPLILIPKNRCNYVLSILLRVPKLFGCKPWWEPIILNTILPLDASKSFDQTLWWEPIIGICFIKLAEYRFGLGELTAIFSSTTVIPWHCNSIWYCLPLQLTYCQRTLASEDQTPVDKFELQHFSRLKYLLVQHKLVIDPSRSDPRRSQNPNSPLWRSGTGHRDHSPSMASTLSTHMMCW